MKCYPEMGDAIRRRRRALDWTQADLAARAGCSVPMVSNIEKHERDASLALLDRIAAAFDMKHSELWRLAEMEEAR